MLFFETDRQAVLFLTTVPAGAALALLLNLSAGARRWGPLWDVLLLLAAGLVYFGYNLYRGADGAHLYQLLALMIGFWLYTYICGFFRNRRKKKREKDVSHGRKNDGLVEHINP